MRQEPVFCGSAGAGSLAAGAATGLSCGEGVVAGRVAGSASQGFSCGQIRSNIFRVTPLVQPKPSCSGYSPAAAGAGRAHVILLHQLLLTVIGMLHVGQEAQVTSMAIFC